MIFLSKNKLGHDANILLSNNSSVSLSSYRKQQGTLLCRNFYIKKEMNIMYKGKTWSLTQNMEKRKELSVQIDKAKKLILFPSLNLLA
jgi:hypothetical protein